MIGRMLLNRLVPPLFQHVSKARMMSTKAGDLIQYKQDLPPPGGYKAYDYERIPSEKPLIGPWQLFIYMACMVYGYYEIQYRKRVSRGERLEILDRNIAITPLLLAERDRLYLKRVRRNFEEECRLMENVPGWEVGKWFDQPLYKTLPKGMWIEQESWEFCAHVEPRLYQQFMHWWWTA